MGTSVFRYDFAPITGSETTDEGYLRVWCRAARSGTQLYRKPDGSQIREYRPPEEVSKPESLSTLFVSHFVYLYPPAEDNKEGVNVVASSAGQTALGALVAVVARRNQDS